LTDTDKENSNLVQLPLTTLGQETRWAYSTPPPSPHGKRKTRGGRREIGSELLISFRMMLCGTTPAGVMV